MQERSRYVDPKRGPLERPDTDGRTQAIAGQRTERSGGTDQSDLQHGDSSV